MDVTISAIGGYRSHPCLREAALVEREQKKCRSHSS